MAVFFFDIRREGVLHHDDEGVEFVDEATALKHAEEGLLILGADRISKGRPLPDMQIIVRGPSGVGGTVDLRTAMLRKAV